MFHTAYDADQRMPLVEHALCTEAAWEDYGRANPPSRNESSLWQEFVWEFANLQKWWRARQLDQQYSHSDMNRFWDAFKRGAYGA